MKATFSSSFLRIAVCVLAMTATLAAGAQRASSPQDVILTNNPSKLAGIGIGLAALGAGVGLGAYYSVHHDNSLTGCATDGPNGLQLETDGDRQTYALVGEVGDIKAGDRVRISGRKQKPNPGVLQLILVSKLKKDLGSCSATAAAR